MTILHQKLNPYFAVFAVTLVAGATTYWLVQQNFQMEVEDPLPVAVRHQISSTTSSAVDTSNWKTYRNEKYGFEVKYPENVEVICTAETPELLSTCSALDFKDITTDHTLTIVVRDNVSKLSSKDFDHQMYESLHTNPDYKELESSVLHMAEHDAFYVAWTLKDKAGKVWYISFDTKIMTITINAADSTSDDNIFKQVLSTLTFTK